MSFTIPTTTTAYASKQVLYPAGIDKDSYNIQSFYTHNLETDVISQRHSVIKNWVYESLEPGKEPKPGKKYKETIFVGTLQECYQKAKEISETVGYWDRSPDNPFEQIFIPPTK